MVDLPGPPSAIDRQKVAELPFVIPLKGQHQPRIARVGAVGRLGDRLSARRFPLPAERFAELANLDCAPIRADRVRVVRLRGVADDAPALCVADDDGHQFGRVEESERRHIQAALRVADGLTRRVPPREHLLPSDARAYLGHAPNQRAHACVGVQIAADRGAYVEVHHALPPSFANPPATGPVAGGGL